MTPKYSIREYTLLALKELTLEVNDKGVYFSPMAIHSEVEDILPSHIKLWQPNILEALLDEDINSDCILMARIISKRVDEKGARVGFRANLSKLAEYEKTNPLPELSPESGGQTR